MDYEVVDPNVKISSHDSEKCGQCTFVANRESIYVNPVEEGKPLINQSF